MGMKKALNRFRKKDLKRQKEFLERYTELVKEFRMQFIPTLKPIDFRTVKAVHTIREVSDKIIKKMDSEMMEETVKEGEEKNGKENS